MARKITIMVPCYNEQDSLPLFYEALGEIMKDERLSNYEWELLFINDGSKDNTLTILKALREKDERVSYIDLSRNFGKEKAMLAGFDYATGDCMIIMDADLQDPPGLIPEMISWWEQGYDDVYAKRKTRGEESYLRKSFSLLFYKILQKTTKIEVLQNVGDFRLLDRSCINALKNIRESERYTKGMFCWIGYRKKEILFDRGDRIAGKSAWNFWSLFSLAIEGITSFTTSPLRISSVFGLVVSIAAFLYMIFILVKTLIFGDPVQGFPTIMTVVLFLGGVQLLSIGILGEYIARIFNESKNRPTYIVREYNGTKL